MHDERVNCIVANAFNGLGDSTGSDDFGYSVAWIDLDDYVEPYGAELPDTVDPDSSDSLSAWLKTWPDVSGCRYALAYINSDGSRSAIGYDTHAEVMAAYRHLESDFLTWEES